MADLKIILDVFIRCLGVTLIAWLTVHFNGKTLIGIIDSGYILVSKLNNKSFNLQSKWLPIATEAEVITVGIAPLAVASLIATSGGKCLHSVEVFLVSEAIILGLFLINFQQANSRENLFGRDFFKNNYVVFILAIVWCLVFSIWGFLAINPAENSGVDRLLVNSNGDMWFYTRRFAGYTLNNLSFDNLPACEYLQVSPKKFSSFIGSIIFYFSTNSVLGITLFQGLFGCTLFLSLFGHWHNFTYNGKRLSRRGTLLAIIWGITSPSIFWLIITSYQSNLLFITIFILGLTATRRICLHRQRYPQSAIPVVMFSFIVNIFAFYIVLLPVALFFYLATLIIYQSEKYTTPRLAIVKWLKLLLTAGICVLLCAIFFNHQVNLEEISGSLDVTTEHGKNLVPLNPWSLIQERPKPMPNRQDFGLWLNIVVGTIFSGLVLRTICRNLFRLNRQGKNHTYYYKDLIAGIAVIIIYVVYLWAYIPLDFTYRLGKFAISTIHPLVLSGLLPIILWYRDRYYQNKSTIFKSVCLGLIVLHIFLHIDKMLTNAEANGKYHIRSTNKLNETKSLTIVKCDIAKRSQKYQNIVGLDLAKKYPNLKINVISEIKFDRTTSPTETIIKGKNIPGKEDSLCIFDIKT